MARVFPHRDEKLTLARQMLAGGKSGYAINIACKARGWGGLGFNDILRLQEEVRRESPVRTAPQVVPVSLPPELMVEADAPVGVLTADPRVQEMVQALVTWMRDTQVEQLRLSQDGRVSLLSWQHLNMGGSRA